MMTDTYAVAIGVADVRSEPDAAAELVTQALLNAPAQADSVQGAWTHVTLTDYTGWIRSDELDELPGKGFCKVGEHCATPLSLTAVISVPQTPLYVHRSGEARLGSAYLSSALPLLNTTDTLRVQIALPGEQSAWLERSAITIHAGETFYAFYPREPLSTVTRYACLFLDTPYLWGGTTIQGIDCSGLVQLCYRMGGYLLPRDADQQYAALTQDVPRSEMREGNLIFFATTSIVHVALALNSSEYIHAEGNRYGRVLINSFDPNNAHYDRRLDEICYAIRRVAQDKE